MNLFKIIFRNFQKQTEEKFQLIPDGRSGKIVYKNAFRSCTLYFEISGVPEYDILIFFDSLQGWDGPAGDLISDQDRRQLREDLEAWLKQERIRAEF